MAECIPFYEMSRLFDDVKTQYVVMKKNPGTLLATKHSEYIDRPTAIKAKKELIKRFPNSSIYVINAYRYYCRM